MFFNSVAKLGVFRDSAKKNDFTTFHNFYHWIFMTFNYLINSII